MIMTNTPSNGTPALQRPAPPGGPRPGLTLGLLLIFLVGLAFVNGATFGLWPENAWVMELRLVKAGLLGALAVHGVVWLLGTLRKRRQGK
jgi:hypothetical protein